jgi:hypothetical protein
LEHIYDVRVIVVPSVLQVLVKLLVLHAEVGHVLLFDIGSLRLVNAVAVLAYGHLLEGHDVASQSAGLVAEDVVDLAELLVEV